MWAMKLMSSSKLKYGNFIIYLYKYITIEVLKPELDLISNLIYSEGRIQISDQLDPLRKSTFFNTLMFCDC